MDMSISGPNIIDDDVSVCDPGVMGCAEVVPWPGSTGVTRIDYTIIHIDETKNWVTYSKYAVLMHEVGHAIGMWHALGTCNSGCHSCTDGCTGEGLPTMTACTVGENCESCGLLASNATSATLSTADIYELQSHYLGAVYNEPRIDDGSESTTVPLPTEGRIHCYPNPFNPRTHVVFEGPGGMRAGESYEMLVVDMRGRAIYRSGGRLPSAAAKIELEWDGVTRLGIPAAAGTYGVIVSTDRFVAQSSVTLLK
jgi:hypothetical protein